MPVPRSYVVSGGEVGPWLRIRPYNQQWTWSHSPLHRTAMSRQDAEWLAEAVMREDVDEAWRVVGARVLPDYDNREPEAVPVPEFVRLVEVERRR